MPRSHLRSSLLVPEQDAVTATPISAVLLGKEFAGDPKKTLEKYKNKIISIRGRVFEKRQGRVVVLESENTDQSTKFCCYFTHRTFSFVDDAPEFTVQGLCTGMQNRIWMRLDNCAVVSDGRDPRRITPEFLPYNPGQTFVYDVAVFPTAATRDATVQRQVYFLGQSGIMESLVTHKGHDRANGQLVQPQPAG